MSFRRGVRSVKGFLDEYACYAAALISLYEAGAGENYLERAIQICEETRQQFSDRDGKGFYFYGRKNSRLILRPRETYDGALPSGNSVMSWCLVRLAQLTGEKTWEQAAKKQLDFLSSDAKEYPMGYSMFLISLLYYIDPPQRITVVLSRQDRAENVIGRLPLYADVRILEEPSEEYRLQNERTTCYICRDQRCLPPVNL